jgi:hypothetical protein
MSELMGWSLILGPIVLMLVMMGRVAGWMGLIQAIGITLVFVALILGMIVGASIVLS